MGLDVYSTTTTANDLAGYFQTGMRPSSVKSAGWGIMADMAQLWNALTAGGGTANAQTVANPRPFATLTTGLTCCFKPTAANTGPTTFSPDGLTPEPIYVNGAPLAGGELQPTVPALLKYDAAIPCWNLFTAANTSGPLTTKNYVPDPCCRVAQGAAAALSTAYQFGKVDLVAVIGAGTAVTAGTIGQDLGNSGESFVTGFACSVTGATITGAGMISFRRRLTAEDAAMLSGRTITFQISVTQNTGAPINGTITINTANALNNFAGGVTAVGTSAAQAIANSDTVPTVLSYNVAVPVAGDNGIEIILAVSVGAIVTKNVRVSDWSARAGNGISLVVPDQFPDDLNRVLRQRETSYEYGSPPGTNSLNGAEDGYVILPGGWATGGTLKGSTAGGARYKVPKVITPTVTLYSASGGAANAIFDANGSGNKAANTTGLADKARFFITQTSGAVIIQYDQIQYHWDADARP